MATWLPRSIRWEHTQGEMTSISQRDELHGPINSPVGSTLLKSLAADIGNTAAWSRPTNLSAVLSNVSKLKGAEPLHDQATAAM